MLKGFPPFTNVITISPRFEEEIYYMCLLCGELFMEKLVSKVAARTRVATIIERSQDKLFQIIIGIRISV